MLKRVKRRYLALGIESEGVFDSKVFMDTVWSAVVKLYGEYGASRTGLTLIDYDGERGFAVVRVLLSAVPMVRASLASITNVAGKPVAVHVVMMSGTLKALHKRLED